MKNMNTICLLLMLTISFSSHAQNSVLKIWPDLAPGSENTENIEQWVGGNDIINVYQPDLTFFLPEHQKELSPAIIIFPGGGYRKLVMNKAYKVAQWLNKNGIVAIVLKYRLKPNEALRDAQRAVSLVRKEAKNYGIYKDKIGVMGFSAGANLAGNLVENNQHFDIYDVVDSISFIPDFWVGIYGPYGDIDESIGRDSSGRRTFKKYEAHKNIPPTFLIHADNDSKVPVIHSITLYKLLHENGIPAELHVYEQGEHGFAMEEDRGAAVTSTVNAWSRRLLEWLKIRGIL